MFCTPQWRAVYQELALFWKQASIQSPQRHHKHAGGALYCGQSQGLRAGLAAPPAGGWGGPARPAPPLPPRSGRATVARDPGLRPPPREYLRSGAAPAPLPAVLLARSPLWSTCLAWEPLGHAGLGLSLQSRESRGREGGGGQGGGRAGPGTRVGRRRAGTLEPREWGVAARGCDPSSPSGAGARASVRLGFPSGASQRQRTATRSGESCVAASPAGDAADPGSPGAQAQRPRRRRPARDGGGAEPPGPQVTPVGPSASVTPRPLRDPEDACSVLGRRVLGAGREAERGRGVGAKRGHPGPLRVFTGLAVLGLANPQQFQVAQTCGDNRVDQPGSPYRSVFELNTLQADYYRL